VAGFTLATPISAPVCAYGLPGRKKATKFSIQRTSPVSPASGCCATLRRGRLHFGYANFRSGLRLWLARA